MTGLAQIIGSLQPIDAGWQGAIPESWLQGRTAYGGLSSALALAVAQRSDDDLPPLRSAQIAFVGPLAGVVTISAQRLRRGRNAAWVQADVQSDAGLGLRAIFVFMREQASSVDHAVGTAPAFTAPTLDTPMVSRPQGVVFTQNFDFADQREDTPRPAEWLRWVRLREREALDPTVELIAVADCLPAAALKLMANPAPVSSMTWQIDLLGRPVPTEGWYLLRADTDHARGGVSSQRMAVWDQAGTPVAAQMQNVALFG